MLTFKLFTMETQLFTKDKQAKRDESHGYKKKRKEAVDTMALRSSLNKFR